MSMNFDDYSTSFQSLMQPMYNVNANYSAYGYGAGIGAGAYGCGSGYGMGYMSPMMNVGVGQFNADYLIKNDDKNNNYYTRPVATHKKKDETGTILGIIGAALGTIALFAALRKGKAPKGGIKPTGKPVNPTPVKPAPANPAPANPAPVNPAPVNPAPVNPAPVNPAPANPALIAPAPANPTPANPALIAPAPVNPISVTPAPVNPNGSAPKPRWFSGEGEYVNFTELPNRSSIVPTGVPQASANNSQISGLLPASSRRTNALTKQNAAMNLPSSNQVYEMGCNPEAYTRAGIMSPQAQVAYDAVAANQFNPGFLREARRADARAAFVSTPQMAQANLNQIRPDLANSGNVVYTTLTPESIANGYSIGANAKGADKLAELRARMQG